MQLLRDRLPVSVTKAHLPAEALTAKSGWPATEQGPALMVRLLPVTWRSLSAVAMGSQLVQAGG